MKLVKIIASGFILLMGLVALIFSILGKIHDDQIRRLGFKTEAVVTDLEKEVHKSNEGRPGRATTVNKEIIWGIYEFTVGKTAYRVKGATSGATLGAKTIVFYDPKDPGVKYVLDADRSGFALGLTISGSFIIAGSILSYRSINYSKSQ